MGDNPWIFRKYKVPGTRNINILVNLEYKNPFLFKGTNSEKLLSFLMDISELLSQNKHFSLVRMGDGEMLFLQGKLVGNMLKRGFLTDDISRYDLDAFKKSALANDYVCLHNLLCMRKLMPKINISSNQKKYSVDTVYTAIATRLMFYILKGYKVGIIGATEKLDIIKNLMKCSEYRSHLGLDDFCEYIEIPQKGCCKDPQETIRIIEKQVTGEADVYLVGISIVKLFVISHLRDKYKKPFIDIGVGVDAIAGVIPNTIPFFGDWVNYRLKGYDYSNIDFFSCQTGSSKKVEHIHWLDNCQTDSAK